MNRKSTDGEVIHKQFATTMDSSPNHKSVDREVVHAQFAKSMDKFRTSVDSLLNHQIINQQIER